MKFKAEFRRLGFDSKHDIVILLETKVKFDRKGTFFIDLGLNGAVFNDPRGRARGIWVLWDQNRVDFLVVDNNFQVIHGFVKKAGFEDWLLSAVYAEPSRNHRDELWENIITMADFYSMPWQTSMT